MLLQFVPSQAGVLGAAALALTLLVPSVSAAWWVAVMVVVAIAINIAYRLLARHRVAVGSRNPTTDRKITPSEIAASRRAVANRIERSPSLPYIPVAIIASELATAKVVSGNQRSPSGPASNAA